MSITSTQNRSECCQCRTKGHKELPVRGKSSQHKAMNSFRKSVRFLKSFPHFHAGVGDSKRNSEAGRKLSNLVRLLSAAFTLLNEPHHEGVRKLVPNLDTILPLLCSHLDQYETKKQRKVCRLQTLHFTDEYSK
jgi:hypothetical protein